MQSINSVRVATDLPTKSEIIEATDIGGAQRIGQDKLAFVYRLICTGTVEEKVQSLQARKAALADALLAESGGESLPITPDDIAALFDTFDVVRAACGRECR